MTLENDCCSRATTCPYQPHAKNFSSFVRSVHRQLPETTRAPICIVFTSCPHLLGYTSWRPTLNYVTSRTLCPARTNITHAICIISASSLPVVRHRTKRQRTKIETNEPKGKCPFASVFRNTDRGTLLRLEQADGKAYETTKYILFLFWFISLFKTSQL